jgi:hypothetical protein
MADQFTGLLSDYLDDEDLSSSERARIAMHLEGCAECRATLVELERVAARARTLEDRPPDADLWPGIETRIQAAATPAALPFRPLSQPARRISFTVPQLVAAGLALMLLSGGTVWLARLGGPGTDFEPISAQVSPAATAVGPRLATAGESGYAATVADLERTLSDGRARLAPETVRALENNLREIDRAIDQCRTALAADPASVYLNSHLANAQRRKLALLRRAAALASEHS